MRMTTPRETGASWPNSPALAMGAGGSARLVPGAAGQQDACAQRRIVGQAVRVAKPADPLVVHQKEIEDRAKECGFLGTGAQVAGGCARRSEKDRQQVGVRGKPGQ